MMDAESRTHDILSALGLALFERTDGRFRPVAPPPGWVERAFDHGPDGPSAALGSAFPFLEYFLEEAERAWTTNDPAVEASGTFTHDGDGRSWLVRARACTVGGRSILVLERLTGEADPRPLLQTAREQQLAFEALTRDAQAMHAPVASVAEHLRAIDTGARGVDAARLSALAAAVAELQRVVAALPQPPRRRP
jgi:hypothetical protein